MKACGEESLFAFVFRKNRMVAENTMICSNVCFSSHLSWQQTAQDCCCYQCYLSEGSFESWPGKDNLNAPIGLGSTQFLRCQLISTFSTTTAHFDDSFTHLSPSVTFFILFPHRRVLALKFLCHRNGLWRVLPLAFIHCSDEKVEQAWRPHRAVLSSDYKVSNLPLVWCCLQSFLLAPSTSKVLQLKIFGTNVFRCICSTLWNKNKQKNPKKNKTKQACCEDMLPFKINLTLNGGLGLH